MTGIPEFNFPAFAEATAALRANGHRVFSPHEQGYDEERTWCDYMRADIIGLMGCEAVACLPGWEKSKGARIEVELADKLGFKIFPYKMLLELGPACAEV